MAEVVIGKTSEEEYWTIDCTDKTQLSKWTRLTEEAGGEIIPKTAYWTRFRIPADKLRFGLRHTRTLSEEQREALRERMQRQRQHGHLAKMDNEDTGDLEDDMVEMTPGKGEG
jgi:hypothetical protein